MSRRVHAVCFRCAWQGTLPSPSKDKDAGFAEIWHSIEKPDAVHKFEGKITQLGGNNEQTP